MYVYVCMAGWLAGSRAAQVELPGLAGLQHLGDHVAHRLELLLALHQVRRGALQKHLHACMYVCKYVCTYICMRIMYACMYGIPR